MTRIFIYIFILVSLFSYAPKAYTWSDDVEGVLMSSTRGQDPMTEGSSIEKNLDESPETESYDGPLINTDEKEESDE